MCTRICYCIVMLTIGQNGEFIPTSDTTRDRIDVITHASAYRFIEYASIRLRGVDFMEDNDSDALYHPELCIVHWPAREDSPKTGRQLELVQLSGEREISRQPDIPQIHAKVLSLALGDAALSRVSTADKYIRATLGGEMGNISLKYTLAVCEMATVPVSLVRIGSVATRQAGEVMPKSAHLIHPTTISAEQSLYDLQKTVQWLKSNDC